jgi:hypothetical protein
VACSKNTKQFVFLILIRNLTLCRVFLLHRNSKFDDLFFQNFLNQTFSFDRRFVYANWKFKNFWDSKLLSNLYEKIENSKYQYCPSWKDPQYCFCNQHQILFIFWIETGVKLDTSTSQLWMNLDEHVWFLFN